MNIGELNKRIELQSPTRVSDGMGGFTVSWAPERTVWAAIWPVSANERIQAMQSVMTLTHRIRIRYYSAIRADWRVRFGVRYFNIISIVNPSERNEMQELLCLEAT